MSGATTSPDDTDDPLAPLNDTSHPHIDERLVASDRDLPITPDDSDKIPVVVETAPNHTAAATSQIAANGTVETHHGNQIQATVNRAAIEPLAESDTINFIRPPHTPQQSELTSEGVETIGADVAHAYGATGENATVAVIEMAIDPEHEPIENNVVETRDFTGTGLDSRDTTHGDATSEVVVDTAPDVNLVLVTVGSGVEFANAAEWVNNHDDIDVATVSLGWYGVRNDGESFLDEAIDSGPQTDTAWFIAAGNDGDGTHWSGEWRDEGGTSDYLSFGSDADDVNCFVTNRGFSAILQWDDWATPSERYALGLYGYNADTERLELVTHSNNDQTAGAPPVESISQPALSGEIYCLAIFKSDAAGSAEFNLFLRSDDPNAELTYATAERSVAVPATNRHAFAIGAVDWEAQTLAPYSSRGPTIDGRLKPELVAPTRVSTTAYGVEAYPGTSAAAPHAAGAAAVVHSANSTATGDTLQTRLLMTATDPAGTDSSSPSLDIGHGLVDVPTALPPATPTEIDVPDSVDAEIHSNIDMAVIIDAPSPESKAVVQLTDSTGQTQQVEASLENTEAANLSVNIEEFEPGTLVVQAKTVDSDGWTNPDGFTATTTTELLESDPNLEQPGAVEFTNQTTNGTAVAIDEIRLDGGGFAVIHDQRLFENETLTSIRGVSTYLPTGTHTNHQVTLDDPLETDETLIVVPYQDTTNTTTFEFVATDGAEDGPYTDTEGDLILDSADIIVDEEPSIAEYTNEEGIIGTTGLLDAANDWRSDAISTSLLLDIASAYRSGTPVA